MKFKASAPSKLNSAISQQAGAALSMRHIKRLIESGGCYLNGHIERFANRTVNAGDEIELIEKENLQPRLILADDAVVAYDKPAGISAVEKGGVIDLATKQFGTLFPVHRLDKGTSGILLFARTKEAAASLETLFRERKVHKEYLAIVQGLPSDEEFEVENTIGRLKGGGFGATPQGQKALTRFTVLRKCQDAALLRARPKTGRTHQIRIHLSGLGLPIFGDGEYGRFVQFRCKAARCMLHAERMQLPHPITGNPLVLYAPLPEDFKEMVGRVFG